MTPLAIFFLGLIALAIAAPILVAVALVVFNAARIAIDNIGGILLIAFAFGLACVIWRALS